jgi:uncharacterized membrane protein
MRTVLWLLAGLVLGAVIHIAMILTLPLLSENTVWSRVAALDALGRTVILPPVEAGAPNPLRLDPELAHAVCVIDLRRGAGVVSAELPAGFWSLAVYGRDGAVLYSTTNRDGIGRNLDLGIFNPAQTRLLATQQLDIAEGLLIVESRVDDVFVVVRLAPPHAAMRARFEADLADTVCGNIS